MTNLLQPVIEPADRAMPVCPHFGPCGGCQLQDVAYPAQLATKAARLRELLAPVVSAMPELQLHPSPPFGYRNRIRLTLSQVEGTFRAGYIRRASNDNTSGEEDLDTGPDETVGAAGATFLPITQCPIAAPLLWRAAECFLELIPKTPWLEERRFTPDQLELFTTADESKLNLTLYLRTNARTLPSRIESGFNELCEALRRRVPELNGAGLLLLPPASRARSRRVEAPRPATSWGAAGLSYAIPLPESNASTAVETYWVPRTAFFQVNRFLLPDLLATAINPAINAPARALAWDLYAGAGLFSRALARVFQNVIAVEIAEAASTALASMKLRNLTAVKATTLDFLRNAVLQRERPDLILLDPPRTGAGAEVCQFLLRVATPKLLYVSCSPSHLASDLQILTTAGYSVEALHLFDLFPQTTHIETLAVLSRQK